MKLLTAPVIAVLLIALCSAAPPAASNARKSTRTYISYFENVLGTSMELKLSAASQQDAVAAEAAAMKEIGRLGKILSAYDAGSEFSRWLTTSGEPVRVSPELFEVLSLFDQWRVRTNGALDASAEVVGKVWKKAAAQQRLPSATELAGAVAEVRLQHWKLDPAAKTATHLSKAPLMLNSFAKSYIIQRAANAAMKAAHVTAAVVNIGGDMVITGPMAETVQISDPKADAENEAPIDRLLVGNKAVATSGNYRRGELIQGRWYSHIVDPRTGQPADAVISATVVAPGATDAGALATAFNVLSPEESVALAAGMPGVDYLIITREGKRIMSKGWQRLEAPVDKKTSTAGSNDKKITEQGWGDDYELVINLEINLQKEGFVKRPYVAVWIEDENHAPVRTVAIWHQRDRYLPELKAWYLKYRGAYTADNNMFGSNSSATRPAGKYTLKWDGKDDKGNMVKPGKYTVKIEAAREHGTYQLMRQEMDFNATPQQVKLPGNVEIAAATLDYRKKTGN